MQLLCPACHTPLASAVAGEVAVACSACALEVDLSRLGTVAGKPRFLPERDRTGATVGGFEIGARLGAGGMGQVYRAALAAETGRAPVAIKFLAAGLAGDDELKARFLREVRVLQGLTHPAIVRVLASGAEEGVPWFAMTLVNGPSLRTRLGEGPLEPEEARVVFARVLAALDHAHERGVVHRDLKPGNVLLGPEGAVLADFGIARPAEPGASGMTRLTETAAILGTLPYMSPEQRTGAPLDCCSDLFSVGVMLYEALTGLLPQGAFAPPSKLRPGLPVAVDRLILRLLQPRAADRFATAAEAARALEHALAPPRRRALGVAAVVTGAAAAMALAAGGWITWVRPPTASVKSMGPPVAAAPVRPAPPAAEVPAPAQIDQRILPAAPPPQVLPIGKGGRPKGSAVNAKQSKVNPRGPKEASASPKMGFSPNSRVKR